MAVTLTNFASLQFCVSVDECDRNQQGNRMRACFPVETASFAPIVACCFCLLICR
jgi:hypothetical protein